MKIIKPYAKILDTSIHNMAEAFKIVNPALSKIEWCSRISHRSEEAQTSDSWKRFIQSVVIDHGDWSVVEHVSVSVDAVVDRGITHEWVRHRLFSFTQESTRFVNYEKKMVPSFIYPQVDVECEHCLSGNESLPFTTGNCPWTHTFTGGTNISLGKQECAYHPAWLSAIMRAEDVYKFLIKDKWRPQEARSVFPNALASRIVVTGNLRNWRHFLIMRTSAETHPQFRQVTIPLLKDFQETFPILFDDIVPNGKQSEAIKKAR
jgi:thymidylate synthase (FAD)